MAHSHNHSHTGEHGHSHDHGHAHSHSHVHSHGLTSPHPVQAVPWSILRMTLATRLAIAVAASAALWAIVLLAMK